jgi:peptide methionine sulfoxide reductase msrA/msrB
MLTWKDVLDFAETGNSEPDRRVVKSDEEWRSSLTPEQYHVARQSGTERPFSHASCQRFEQGIYRCVCCQELLFNSQVKFDSGTGWPSFSQPIEPNAISYHADRGHGMVRVEVKCNVCGAHLGHVFPDGPQPSGLRFCINGIVLEKVEDEKSVAPTKEDAASSSEQVTRLSSATFGGGCFWCTEAIFQRLRGVHRVESGYSGGNSKNPTYEEVCSGQTGHAEVIQVTYDPTQISFSDLVTLHLCTHDPTTLNRQGADQGTQYRSIIFYSTAEERTLSLDAIQAVESAIGKRIVTELQPFEIFYPAEDSHQDYFNRNRQSGYCAAVIEPKLTHLRQRFAQLLQ